LINDTRKKALFHNVDELYEKVTHKTNDKYDVDLTGELQEQHLNRYLRTYITKLYDELRNPKL
jgi:hypothetical protein